MCAGPNSLPQDVAWARGQASIPRKRFPGHVSSHLATCVRRISLVVSNRARGLRLIPPGVQASGEHWKAIRFLRSDFPACRMSADMQHLEEADLYDEVEGIIRASDFIEKTDGAQLLFI